ncbi:hypothetical protein L1887_07428 [Cichorium endivia]|nr:hypothetical protein L1887_07428 [Cichorium endivia]
MAPLQTSSTFHDLYTEPNSDLSISTVDSNIYLTSLLIHQTQTPFPTFLALYPKLKSQELPTNSTASPSNNRHFIACLAFSEFLKA